MLLPVKCLPRARRDLEDEPATALRYVQRRVPALDDRRLHAHEGIVCQRIEPGSVAVTLSDRLVEEEPFQPVIGGGRCTGVLLSLGFGAFLAHFARIVLLQLGAPAERDAQQECHARSSGYTPGCVHSRKLPCGGHGALSGMATHEWADGSAPAAALIKPHLSPESVLRGAVAALAASARRACRVLR